MNPLLRDRILRRLDVMSDERAYQVLDYIEFLESKYAERPTLATSFQHFADGIEDTLRAGRLPAALVAEAMTFLDRAAGVLSGVAAAGKSVATDIVQAATKPVGQGPASRPASEPPPSLPRHSSWAGSGGGGGGGGGGGVVGGGSGAGPGGGDGDARS